MRYRILFSRRALKDLKALPTQVKERIMKKIEDLESDLAGDVKKLTNYSPEYRLRVGKYRVLFELNDDVVVIFKVVHRRDAY